MENDAARQLKTYRRFSSLLQSACQEYCHACLELKEIVAAPRQSVKVRQGAPNCVASPAPYHHMVRSIGGLGRDLDGQAAAVLTYDFETRPIAGYRLRQMHRLDAPLSEARIINIKF